MAVLPLAIPPIDTRLELRAVALIVTTGCVLVASACMAQEGQREHVETDRDSFTPATTTVAPGRLVLESAYSFIDNRSVPETHSFPELLVRFGVADWLELRFGANYEVGGESSSISGSGSGGGAGFDSAEIESEANVSYGLKAALSSQDAWLPRTAAIVQGFTPTSGADTNTNVVVTYVWGWEIGGRLCWDSAIRYGHSVAEEDRFNRWAPSTVLKAQIHEQWNAHIEYFGIFTDGRSDELSQSYLSPGLHCLVTPDLEVGMRVGWGLGGDAANFFSNVGVGLQF
mgnify:CR=1 FL=1